MRDSRHNVCEAAPEWLDRPRLRQRSPSASSRRTAGRRSAGTPSGPREGRLSSAGVSHRKYVLYGMFVWVRRALTSRKRRFPARADGAAAAAAGAQGDAQGVRRQEERQQARAAVTSRRLCACNYDEPVKLAQPFPRITTFNFLFFKQRSRSVHLSTEYN